MSGKILQMFPRASTFAIRERSAVQDSRSTLFATSPDIGFLRSWFEHDSECGEVGDGINWGAISGLALSIALSASCWTGVAWILTRVWR